ncbi:MAG: type II toxin-antitoxin system VapC family toxin [Gaiellaceae bacterium]
MIVVDASSVVPYLVELGEDSDWVADRLRNELTFYAPELIDPEALSGLRRLVVQQLISAEAATQAVADLLDARIVRYPHRPFVQRAWELRGRLTSYDALYVALAEAIGATLVTTDRRLARAVTTVDVAVPS